MSDIVSDRFDRQPVRTEDVPCTHRQWNHPYPPNRPWVDRGGRCTMCKQEVAFEEIGPSSPNTYFRVATPHTKTIGWYEVRSDELERIIEPAELDWGAQPTGWLAWPEDDSWWEPTGYPAGS